MPPKPQGSVCVIDIKDQFLICEPIASMTKIEDVRNIRQSHTAQLIPLSQADNYIAFSPDTWGNIELYINELEQLGKQCQTSTKP